MHNLLTVYKCGGRTMPPQRCSSLNLEPVGEYITIHGQSDFLEMRQVRKFEMRKSSLDYQGGPNLIPWILKIGKPVFMWSERGKYDYKRTVRERQRDAVFLALKSKEGCHKPGNVGSL